MHVGTCIMEREIRDSVLKGARITVWTVKLKEYPDRDARR